MLSTSLKSTTKTSQIIWFFNSNLKFKSKLSSEMLNRLFIIKTIQLTYNSTDIQLFKIVNTILWDELKLIYNEVKKNQCEDSISEFIINLYEKHFSFLHNLFAQRLHLLQNEFSNSLFWKLSLILFKLKISQLYILYIQVIGFMANNLNICKKVSFQL
jgi:hypothetical protein